MKKCRVVFIVLALIFGLTAVGLCGEKEQVGEQLKELYGKQAFLESAYMGIVNEFQAVQQEAKKHFAKADKVLEGKDRNNLMCADALVLVTAGFYEVLLENLALKATLIEVEMTLIQQEIGRLENRLQALKKGVSA